MHFTYSHYKYWYVSMLYLLQLLYFIPIFVLLTWLLCTTVPRQISCMCFVSVNMQRWSSRLCSDLSLERRYRCWCGCGPRMEFARRYIGNVFFISHLQTRHSWYFHSGFLALFSLPQTDCSTSPPTHSFLTLTQQRVWELPYLSPPPPPPSLLPTLSLCHIRTSIDLGKIKRRPRRLNVIWFTVNLYLELATVEADFREKVAFFLPGKHEKKKRERGKIPCPHCTVWPEHVFTDESVHWVHPRVQWVPSIFKCHIRSSAYVMQSSYWHQSHIQCVSMEVPLRISFKCAHMIPACTDLFQYGCACVCVCLRPPQGCSLPCPHNSRPSCMLGEKAPRSQHKCQGRCRVLKRIVMNVIWHRRALLVRWASYS